MSNMAHVLNNLAYLNLTSLTPSDNSRCLQIVPVVYHFWSMLAQKRNECEKNFASSARETVNVFANCQLWCGPNKQLNLSRCPSQWSSATLHDNSHDRSVPYGNLKRYCVLRLLELPPRADSMSNRREFVPPPPIYSSAN
jgi:hypothetical protein